MCCKLSMLHTVCCKLSMLGGTAEVQGWLYMCCKLNMLGGTAWGKERSELTC